MAVRCPWANQLRNRPRFRLHQGINRKYFRRTQNPINWIFEASASAMILAFSSMITCRLLGERWLCPLLSWFPGCEDRNGHIKPKILLVLHGFDKYQLIGLKLARSPEHGVCPLESFDGNYGPFANDHALSNIQPGDFLGNVNSVLRYVLSIFSNCLVMGPVVASSSSRNARASIAS